ncbi:hypothetical protein CHLRE_06g254232v5 [Chlamydomonas reinhardtii]|uniref:Uncharacterized protein n=1 Tax=Chlamydomonas reinhardtii TaxID=3055 RepID=A0A2K3DM83_CHLRE|nr:uncharacterized protein CHLRE_06g254232v5 [Chlamydomonas reinhardtii]PNW81642.1 hypothetical protein CHLRE_06g254232v5 [Chlamydomonas reinhardtii]
MKSEFASPQARAWNWSNGPTVAGTPAVKLLLLPLMLLLLLLAVAAVAASMHTAPRPVYGASPELPLLLRALLKTRRLTK